MASALLVAPSAFTTHVGAKVQVDTGSIQRGRQQLLAQAAKSLRLFGRCKAKELPAFVFE